jgi:hypothetical protein
MNPHLYLQQNPGMLNWLIEVLQTRLETEQKILAEMKIRGSEIPPAMIQETKSKIGAIKALAQLHNF